MPRRDFPEWVGTPIERVGVVDIARWQLGNLLGITPDQVDELVGRLVTRSVEVAAQPRADGLEGSAPYSSTEGNCSRNHSKALAALGHPDLPGEVRVLYTRAVDYAGAALGLDSTRRQGSCSRDTSGRGSSARK